MTRVMGVLMVVGLVLACEPDKGSNATTVTTNTKTETKTVAGGKTTEVKTEIKNSETVPGEVGVGECDDYLKKMTDCEAHAPTAFAGPLKEARAGMRKTWAQTATTPQGKADVVESCKQALASAKTAYASLGCSL